MPVMFILSLRVVIRLRLYKIISLMSYINYPFQLELPNTLYSKTVIEN
jgi:hypothetical protein